MKHSRDKSPVAMKTAFIGIRKTVLFSVVTVAFLVPVFHYFVGLNNIAAMFIPVNSESNGFNISTLTTTDLAANPFDITIVTLYIKMGRFKKGFTGLHYDSSMYLNWMKSWGMLTNRVIGFFDDDATLEFFKNIRSRQPPDKSVLIKIDRKDIPAFKYLDRIKEIFQQPGYPQYPPNTVLPEYSAAMNAKYDALQMAIEKGLVHTKYIAWLDIGLFRDLENANMRPAGGTFTLEVPDNFNSTCVSMSEVTPRSQVSHLSPRDYIYNNTVWVGGAFLLGTREKIWTFADSYKIMYKELLDQNLSSTDQQIIGSMYSPDYIKQQKVDMKTYTCPDGKYSIWFCLAYLCKEAAEKRRIVNGMG